jgi:D-glycero-alpha-D-manno-heptose 1-phosphate guanylyltransferase
VEAIILAGGFGTRLREIISDVPKPMAPIAGRPFLEILLGNLEKKGFKRIILSLGYKADKVITHFGSKFRNMELSYEIEHSPLGTGGAVRASLMHCRSNHVFVFNGDTFLDLETSQIEALWFANQNPIIVARKVQDTLRYGRLCDDGGYVAELVDKGVAGPGLINAGCYLLPTHVLDSYELGQVFSLEADFLRMYIQKTPVELFVSKGYFIDIGIPSDYQRAQIELPKFF